MIDRSYLPYQAAREHQDRGMAKWMGFFLSEHTTSLHEDTHKVDLTSPLSPHEKLTLLGQLYAGQLKGQLIVKQDQSRTLLSGFVEEITLGQVTLKTTDGYHLVKLEDILDVTLDEESEE